MLISNAELITHLVISLMHYMHHVYTTVPYECCQETLSLAFVIYDNQLVTYFPSNALVFVYVPITCVTNG